MQMNVSMTPELYELVQRKVHSGLYGNASEVVRDALRRMDERAIVDEAWNELNDKLAAATASGRCSVSVSDVFAHACRGREVWECVNSAADVFTPGTAAGRSSASPGGDSGRA